MEFRDYLRILRKHLILVLVCVAIGLAATAYELHNATPTYQSKTELFVSTTTKQTVSDLLESGYLAQQRVTSYVDIVNSPLVGQAVAQTLHNGMSPAQIAGEISVTNPVNTVLLDVTVTDSSPVRAQAIAQAVGAQLADVIKSVEAAELSSGNRIPVKVSVLRPAALDRTQVSPKVHLDLVVGIILGFIVGLAGAVLRETLDTTVKSAQDISRRHKVPTLGVVPFHAEAKKLPLVTSDGERSLRGEAYRQLRTNLQFVDVDNSPKSIVVTSSVPDEGKTVTACNLAITLADAGLKVLLIEADLRRPKVGQYLGISSDVGVTNVLIGQCTPDDAIQEWGSAGLRVLPSGLAPPNPSELLGSQRMVDLLRYVSRDYQVVILDATPLLPVTDAAVLAALSDGVLLVIRQGKTRRDQVARSIETLQSVGAHVLGAVMNMVPVKGPYAYGYGYGYGYYQAAATTTPVGSAAGGGSTSPRSRQVRPILGDVRTPAEAVRAAAARRSGSSPSVSVVKAVPPNAPGTSSAPTGPASAPTATSGSVAENGNGPAPTGGATNDTAATRSAEAEGLEPDPRS